MASSSSQTTTNAQQQQQPSMTIVPKKPQTQSVEIGYKCGECERQDIDIASLYYCHHCQKLKCSTCVSMQIESYYCSNCLDSVTPTEASYNNNECKKCVDCPVCASTLRIVEDKKAKDPFYFSCGFCRWTSQSIPKLNASDPSALLVNMMDLEQADTQRTYVTKLIEQLQKQEKDILKEKKQATLGRTKKSGHSLLMKSLSSTATSSNKLAPVKWQELDKQLAEKEQKLTNFLKHQPQQTQTPSSQQNTTTLINLNTTTTLDQRLKQASQTRQSEELRPRRKHLLTRVSKKCKKCEKALVKPDISPAKVAFSRKHIALLYLPVFTLSQPSKLQLSKQSYLILKISNPVPSQMTVNLADLGTLIIPSQDYGDDEQHLNALKQKDDKNLILERSKNWVKVRIPITATSSKFRKQFEKIGVEYTHANAQHNFAFGLSIIVSNIYS